MKRALLTLSIISVLIFILSACSLINKSGDSMMFENNNSALIAPKQFADEQEFLNALKNGTIEEIYKPDRLTFYFKPANVTSEMILDSITLTENDLVFNYYIGNNSEENKYSMQWLRNFDNHSQYINDWNKRLGDELYSLPQIENINSPRIQLNEEEIRQYNESIQVLNDNGFLLSGTAPFKEKPQTESNNIPQTWLCHFTFDNKCFSANIPYFVSDVDLPKYFIMEKINVN